MDGKKQRIAVHLFWISLSIVICWGAVQLDLGLLTEPGPGFMPFIMGVLLFVLTIASVFEKVPAVKRPPLSGKSLGKVGMTMAALLIYALLLPVFGFIPVTLLFMMFLFAVIQEVKWPIALIAAVLSVTLCYLLFSSLGAEFPKGYFS